MRDLNPQPSAYKAGALPIELIRRCAAPGGCGVITTKINEHRRDYKPALLLCVTLVLGLACARGAAADDDDDDVPPPVTQGIGAAGRTLQVPPEVQRQSGIELTRLDAAHVVPERDGQGRVVDVAPLLELRWRHRDAAAAEESARAALARARSAVDRLQLLRRNPDDVSERQLLEAETAHAEQVARLHSAQARRRALHETVLREWGAEIAARALAADGTEETLFAGAALLLLALPGAPGPDTRLHAGMDGTREAAVAVSLLGEAPGGALSLPGSAWFGLVPARGFRVGAHVRVWIADGAARAGVRVPRAAIVWHGGQPWVYRRVDAVHFARHGVAGGMEADGSWFVVDPSLVGAAVVTRGAQTLLSEELRAQIPDEDDDP